MLNKILCTALVTSVGFNLFLLSEEVIVEDNLDQEIEQVIDDTVSVAQSSTMKNKIITKKSIAEMPQETKDFEFDEKAYQQAMITSKSLWKRKVQDLIEIKLGLSESAIRDYENLKKDRLEEMNEFFNSKSKGNNYTTYLDLEEKIEYSKIDLKYFRKLKSIFGEDFDRYQALIKEHNEEVSRSNKYFYPIEL